eukprot:3562493-Amphidinium_carterae.1
MPDQPAEVAKPAPERASDELNLANLNLEDKGFNLSKTSHLNMYDLPSSRSMHESFSSCVPDSIA